MENLIEVGFCSMKDCFKNLKNTFILLMLKKSIISRLEIEKLGRYFLHVLSKRVY